MKSPAKRLSDIVPGAEVHLSSEAREDIAKIIRDNDKLPIFLRDIECAIGVFVFAHVIKASTKIDPTRIKRLSKTSSAFIKALTNLNRGDKHHLWRAWSNHLGGPEGAAKFNNYLTELEEDARRLEILTKQLHYGAERGRPRSEIEHDFIRLLAGSFRNAGKRVSSGDRSQFVQLVEIIYNEFPIAGKTSIRHRVRAALAGENS